MRKISWTQVDNFVATILLCRRISLENKIKHQFFIERQKVVMDLKHEWVVGHMWHVPVVVCA